MKYYLIKTPICLIGIEEINCVELTEDGIQTLADLTTTRLPNALNDSLRKILE